MGMMYIYSMKQLNQNIHNGRIVGCEKCGVVFDDGDKAYVLETGRCQYCHKVLDRAKTI